MRIGINTGLAVVTQIRGESAYMTALGDTVNLASRLQTLAEPGTVLLSEATHRLVEGLVETSFAGEQVIKGKSEPQKVYRLEARRGSRRRSGGASASMSGARKDWLSVGKRACVWTSAGAEALRVNPSPRRSLRSGARVSEGPELAGSRSAKVQTCPSYATTRNLCCSAPRRSAMTTAWFRRQVQSAPRPRGP